jgi:hypothetical protein
LYFVVVSIQRCGFGIQSTRTGDHQMAESAKPVTSNRDREDRDEKKPLDTNRPVALAGLSRQHLDNQQGGETKSDKNKEE